MLLFSRIFSALSLFRRLNEDGGGGKSGKERSSSNFDSLISNFAATIGTINR